MHPGLLNISGNYRGSSVWWTMVDLLMVKEVLVAWIFEIFQDSRLTEQIVWFDHGLTMVRL